MNNVLYHAQRQNYAGGMKPGQSPFRRRLKAKVQIQDQIDTSDIPELTSKAWKNAVRGLFYRPGEIGSDINSVVLKLGEHKGELQAAGIVHLRVFGSVARGEAAATSDVDLMADFDKSKRMTLVKIGSLQGRLTEFLVVHLGLSSGFIGNLGILSLEDKSPKLPGFGLT
jgi:hypothetical protein